MDTVAAGAGPSELEARWDPNIEIVSGHESPSLTQKLLLIDN